MPRGKRREIKDINEASRDKLLAAVNSLRDKFDADVTGLAEKHGYYRSTVAELAYGTTKEIHHRGPSYKNAFVSGRMAELNEGECFIFSFSFHR
jgi:hypothetical protein